MPELQHRQEACGSVPSPRRSVPRWLTHVIGVLTLAVVVAGCGRAAPVSTVRGTARPDSTDVAITGVVTGQFVGDSRNTEYDNCASSRSNFVADVRGVVGGHPYLMRLSTSAWHGGATYTISDKRDVGVSFEDETTSFRLDGPRPSSSPVAGGALGQGEGAFTVDATGHSGTVDVDLYQDVSFDIENPRPPMLLLALHGHWRCTSE